MNNEVNKILYDYFMELRPDLRNSPTPIEELPLNRLIDSLGMMEFLFFIEENFNIEISDKEVVPSNFANMTSVASFVNHKLINKQEERP